MQVKEGVLLYYLFVSLCGTFALCQLIFIFYELIYLNCHLFSSHCNAPRLNNGVYTVLRFVSLSAFWVVNQNLV